LGPRRPRPPPLLWREPALIPPTHKKRAEKISALSYRLWKILLTEGRNINFRHHLIPQHLRHGVLVTADRLELRFPLVDQLDIFVHERLRVCDVILGLRHFDDGRAVVLEELGD